jgi:hypothetical protein
MIGDNSSSFEIALQAPLHVITIKEELSHHHGVPGYIPSDVMLDLCSRMCRWGWFYPGTYISPTNSHSIDCSAVIINLSYGAASL